MPRIATSSFSSATLFTDVRSALRRAPNVALQAAAAVALLCALGPGMINAMPQSPAQPMTDMGPATPADGTALASPRSRCPGCGLVSAIRHIEAAGVIPAAYELTVRMRDGSVRTSSAASAGSWVVGDRIILVSGTSASLR